MLTRADPDADEEVETQSAAAHARRSSERLALETRLRQDNEDDLADILAGCGQPLRLHCTCCGALRIVESRCRKRWCPVCARSISAKRVAKYVGAVESMQWPLFVTLTRRNLPSLSLADIKHMRRAYRRLRQQRWWSRAVKGGIASLEITNTGRGWHPHIHSIVDCRWLSKTVPAPRPIDGRRTMQRKFAAAATEVGTLWAAALGEPRATVHVKRAYTPRTGGDPSGRSQSIAVEVLKYSVKPSDMIDCEEPVGPLIRLIGAARLVSSWGSCYGRKLDPDDDKPYTGAMCDCGASGCWIPESCVDSIVRSTRRGPRRAA